jgi:hypothetical protein
MDAADHSTQTIVPNKRVKESATAISKAADTVKMGAALGPWIVANREAGASLR